jgi:hypothetical protein
VEERSIGLSFEFMAAVKDAKDLLVALLLVCSGGDSDASKKSSVSLFLLA